ncbi:MAG: chemotaxis response regulator protein-glutamate methylesterase [Chloroflexota bacterium]
MSPIGTPAPIRVLVVDDSAFMRQSVRRVLDAEPDIEVVDIARDGLEGLLKLEQLRPDVVTMDVEMPRLDGLATLKLLMERLPSPVVMFSSLTAAGTEATVKALSLGAVDFMRKPTAAGHAGISEIAAELVEKVRHAARTRVRTAAAARSAPPPVRSVGPSPVSGERPNKLLVVGSSTGGPRALAELVADLPGQLGAAALLVQHLPAGFTRSLAERLDQASSLGIAEACNGESLMSNRVLLAPGDFHLELTLQRVTLNQGPKRHGVRPSVDVTLESAAAIFGPATLAVILTGMGEDGRDGCRAVKAAGGTVLAEAESTCVVYGMPRAVVEAGLADEIVPLDKMAAAITRHLARLNERTARRPVHA